MSKKIKKPSKPKKPDVSTQDEGGSNPPVTPKPPKP